MPGSMPPASRPGTPARLVDYRCPKGHVVTRIPETLIALGPSRRTCPLCGAVVEVPQYREWADMTPEQQASTRRQFRMQTLLAGSFVGFMLAATAAVAGILAHLPGAAWGAIALLAYLAGLGIWAAFLAQRIRRSLARTRASARVPT